MKAKRLIAILSASTLLVSFSACSNSKKTESNEEVEESSRFLDDVASKDAENNSSESQKEKAEISANSIEELNDLVSKDVENSISELKTEYEQLKGEINTYDKYSENTDKIETFYNNVSKTNNELCLKMYEYSLKYAELIISSDKSFEDKYDDLDEIYDNIYDDAYDDIYDGIYDGVLADIYDDFYNGILEEAYDTVPYDKWYNARSDEYDLLSDTRSDVYDALLECRSDIYEFCSDLRSDILKKDAEKAEKTIEDFREDIKKLRED